MTDIAAVLQNQLARAKRDLSRTRGQEVKWDTSRSQEDGRWVYTPIMKTKGWIHDVAVGTQTPTVYGRLINKRATEKAKDHPATAEIKALQSEVDRIGAQVEESLKQATTDTVAAPSQPTSSPPVVVIDQPADEAEAEDRVPSWLLIGGGVVALGILGLLLARKR